MARVPGRSGKFAAYVVVGAAGTAVHYAALVSLVSLARVDEVLASTVGFVLGALCNYLLNHRFTFRSSKAHREAMPRFLTVAAIGWVINGAVMFAGVTMLQVHYLAAQVMATLVVLFWGYTVNKIWTFGPERLRPP